MKSVVVVAVLFLTTLASAAPVSTIEPPPGWIVESSPAAMEQVERMRHMEGITRAEVRQWKNLEGDSVLMVLEFEVARNNEDIDNIIDHAETGATRNRAGTQLALTRHDEGNTVVVDQITETAEARIHSRRHYAADNKNGLHSVTTSCIGPAGRDVPECKRALATFTWLFAPVSRGDARAHNVAYQMGRYIGYAVIIGLGIWLSTRASRKKPA